VQVTGNKSPLASASAARYTSILAQNGAADGNIHTIDVHLSSPDESLGRSTNYSYTLQLQDGALHATAASPYGVGYALEMLSQLIDSSGSLLCNGLSVIDSPMFEHRGIMIDTGRRFYLILLVRSILEGMAMNRMNILHLHLSEECFRVESKLFPGLISGCVVNGHNDTAFYTQAQITELVLFAKARGVIPEFDMPGHSGGFCNLLKGAGIKCCGSQIEEDDP
jgi:hexosaminidase